MARKPLPPGSTTARGYGFKHQRERDSWKPYVDAGMVDCDRCGRWIQPGTPWDLGHDDHDRTTYRGPEHATCNRTAGAHKRNGTRAKRFQRRVTERNSRRW